MTEEEKAEKYLITFLQKNNVVDILPLKTSWDLRCLLIDVIKYVLSEGRKEVEKENEALIKENNILVKGLGCETCSITDEYKNLNSQIAELKAQVQEQQVIAMQRIADKELKIVKLEAQVEKMKCCANCKHHNFSYMPYYCNKNNIAIHSWNLCDKWELAEKEL